MPRKSAFTLIELLVVVTIIVVLLALLTPALDKAIESAERAACGARLHGWGLIVPQYSMDHRGRLLIPVRNWSVALYPNLVWGFNGRAGGNPADPALKIAEWSVQTLRPYLPMGDIERREYGKIWYCPSAETPAKHEANKVTVDNALGGWFVSDYAYFARSDVWGQAHVPAAKREELTQARLAPGRLLMADAIYLGVPSTQSWWLNHGEAGPSVHDPGWGGPVQTGVPLVAGTNQLFGDGSARWKGANQFNPRLMRDRATSEGWVSAGAGPDPNVEINFW